MAEPSVATETQSKTIAIEIDPFETLDTKDTFEEDPEENDEDEASNNEESKEEGKKESVATSKKQEVVAKCKAKGKAITTEETDIPNLYGPNNA